MNAKKQIRPKSTKKYRRNYGLLRDRIYYYSNKRTSDPDFEKSVSLLGYYQDEMVKLKSNPFYDPKFLPIDRGRRPVLKIDEKGNVVRYESLQEAGRKNNHYSQTIWKFINTKKRESSVIWKYA